MAVNHIDELKRENLCLRQALAAKDEIIQLVYDYLTSDPVVVKKKWGVCGMKAQELIIDKSEALKGGAG